MKGKNTSKMIRTTRESKVKIEIILGQNKNSAIDTSINFFNHMLETIAWQGCFELKITYKNIRYRLTHVICEDVGIVFGKTVLNLARRKIKHGVEGMQVESGGVIDEAMAVAGISFEGRAKCIIDLKNSEGARKEKVEDAKSDDLKEFFEGFSQGAKCTVNIKSISGKNSHHSWEAVFRAFGKALHGALKENKWRKGIITGIKGILD